MLWLLASSVCSKIQSKHEIELNQSKSEEKHMTLNMYRSLFQKCIPCPPNNFTLRQRLVSEISALYWLHSLQGFLSTPLSWVIPVTRPCTCTERTERTAKAFQSSFRFSPDNVSEVSSRLSLKISLVDSFPWSRDKATDSRQKVFQFYTLFLFL